MKILLKKENLKLTILSLAQLILGVLFCVMPITMFNSAESILCTLLFVVGGICVVLYALMPQEDKVFKLLFYGMIAVALGLCMVMFPRFFGISLSVIAGLGGLLLFIDALKNRKKSDKAWIADFVIGLIVLILALVAIILSGTNASKHILSIFYGVMLLTQAIYGLFQIVTILKANKRGGKNNSSLETSEQLKESD